MVSPQLEVKPCRFPQEIYDMIIDHLHDDKRALSTCSMVCRAWTSPSRYHLFQSLVLEDSHLRGPAMEDFHNLLDMRPEACEYVRALKITAGRWDKAGLVDLDSLGRMANRFRRLKSVHLIRLTWTIDETRKYHQFASPSVKCLTISGNRTFDPTFSTDTLFSIFHIFPHATSLDLKDHVCSMRSQTGFPPDHQLETLVLRDALLFALITQRIRQTSRHSLKSLVVHQLFNLHLVGLGELLEQAGSNLEHFGLDIGRIRATEPGV